MKSMWFIYLLSSLMCCFEFGCATAVPVKHLQVNTGDIVITSSDTEHNKLIQPTNANSIQNFQLDELGNVLKGQSTNTTVIFILAPYTSTNNPTTNEKLADQFHNRLTRSFIGLRALNFNHLVFASEDGLILAEYY